MTLPAPRQPIKAPSKSEGLTRDTKAPSDLNRLAGKLDRLVFAAAPPRSFGLD